MFGGILLTGGTGKLGKAIIESNLFPNLLAPARDELDITMPSKIKNFFEDNDFDAVIHCAALAKMKECQENPEKAVETNIMGTDNLVSETIKKEKTIKKNIRFIHISTDGVYAGTKGNYKETDETIPYNKYGETKLGAENQVKILKNFCIIRTSFFDPNNIKFNESAIDVFSSKVPINYLVKAIKTMLNNNFVGIINIGSERKSDYERYKEFKSEIKECKFDDYLKNVNYPIAKDASMDCSLWKKIEDNKKENQ